MLWLHRDCSLLRWASRGSGEWLSEGEEGFSRGVALYIRLLSGVLFAGVPYFVGDLEKDPSSQNFLHPLM